jgi:hypothetical protein
VDTISQVFSTPARGPHQASTRHHVDEHFAEILAKDFAIAYALRCRARRHGRGSYRVPREGPPGRSVDRRDRHESYGAHRPAGCSLRAFVVDVDILDRIAQHLGIAR